MGSLEAYNQKRDFRKTSEPKGDAGGKKRGKERAFTVQKHDASRLHYDFRLELDGVLKSWAIPKGPSDDPSDKRLAVMVEDHPLDYGDFEGVIPEGEYGGGPVLLWDRGTWEPEGEGDPRKDLEGGSLKFTLSGEKLKGSWALVRMKGRGDDNWLLIKHKDRRATRGKKQSLVEREPRSVKTGRTIEEVESGGAAPESEEDPAEIEGAVARKSPPSDLSAELATLVEEPPDGDDWLHEIKYDGYRILAILQDDDVKLVTRNGKNWTKRFAAVADAMRGWGAHAILDGEVVVLDDNGVSSFQALQRALKSKHASELVYYAFDLLWMNDHDLTGATLRERKGALRGLLDRCARSGSEVVRYSDHLEGKGPAFHKKACRSGLEGIICKRADSTYRGKRTRDWLKVKCAHRQEFVIVGFTEPSGSREGFGALLLGVYDEENLRYAGRVGTGFNERQLKDLRGRLEKITRKTSPLEDPPTGREARGITWVRPELVAEVAFTEWTDDNRLRHPTFQGLREDKEAANVRREATETPESGASKSGPAKKTILRGKARGDDDASVEVEGVVISHPDRQVFPDAGLTKLEVARYYAEVAPHLLEHIADRPLSVVRCPQGREQKCFYQKHHTAGMPPEIGKVSVKEKSEHEDYLTVDSAAGVVSLVQFGALEIHPWLSRNDRLERPDVMVFDFDPADDVAWEEVLGASYLMRDVLQGFDLASFAKLTGGKGIHVVVPLLRRHEFEVAKGAAKALAERVRDHNPAKFLTTSSKSKRKGKIFIDYLRNGRGATAVAPFSARARRGAPVAAPVRWDELGPSLKPDQYDIRSFPRRLKSLQSDPWDGFFEIRQSLTKGMRRDLGIS